MRNETRLVLVHSAFLKHDSAGYCLSRFPLHCHHLRCLYRIYLRSVLGRFLQMDARMNYLTGRRRYRSTYAGLILQVEFCYWDYPQWRCEWRDADNNDVMPIELVK